MDQGVVTRIAAAMENFRLPRYEEIPDVGLYLEQVAKYICDVLEPLGENAITMSMISNYVKRGLIANPVKKQYNQEQIAYLIYISVVKSVLTMEDIRLTINLQQKMYTGQRAYDYFCSELENLLAVVFGWKKEPDMIGEDSTEEKIMLRNVIITVAHKVYLDKLFAELH